MLFSITNLELVAETADPLDIVLSVRHRDALGPALPLKLFSVKDRFVWTATQQQCLHFTLLFSVIILELVAETIDLLDTVLFVQRHCCLGPLAVFWERTGLFGQQFSGMVIATFCKRTNIVSVNSLLHFKSSIFASVF